MFISELSRTLIATCIAAFLLAFVNIEHPVVFSFSEKTTYLVTGSLLTVGIVSLFFLVKQAMNETNEDEEEIEQTGLPSNLQEDNMENEYIRLLRDDDLVEALMNENLRKQDEREISENDIQEMTAEKILRAKEIRDELNNN
ncbi:hypothetical protein ACFQE1_03355 [Halobium palmae]|uniref:Uncharacterized protein n=1 Tax=Halobium palmae TaxID=1776492 RepID=A0ABD5RXG0_9EURY